MKIDGFALIIVLITFFSAFLSLLAWEWHLIRDIAIAFMPVYSAEALAWFGTLFGFGLIVNKTVTVTQS